MTGSSLAHRARVAIEAELARASKPGQASTEEQQDSTVETLSHRLGHGDLRERFAVDVLQSFFQERMRAEREIAQKRTALPWAGNPTSDFRLGHEGRGYYRHFQHASVFWRLSTGAREVHGAIRDRYGSLGWEASYLRYPQTDELSTIGSGEEVRYSNFEFGTLLWTASRGAYIALDLDVRVKRHQQGAWVEIAGQGFTPGGTVRFNVEKLEGAAGPKSTGVFTIAGADGRFSNVVWDGTTWPRGGTADLRAIDQASGKSVTEPIPALH